MTTLFISDLHLSEERPHCTRSFLDFLASSAVTAEALYILGDLFNLWVGDDHATPLSETVATGLHTLAQRGVAVYFMHGNRDFLIGQDYANRCAMALLNDPAHIILNGRNVALSHGDQLCTDDVEYQRFRETVRTTKWADTFLAKPIAERLAFAHRARDESRMRTASKSAAIMDVNSAAVDRFFQTQDIATLIHGHTHRPAVHNGGEGQRIVLGDWYEQGSVLVHEDKGGFELKTLPA